MPYLVLARKFRPQLFEELVGQEHVTQTLTNALKSQRLAHAYIFSGPRGCGKTTTARILAKALNCVKGPTATPCGECPQCREIAAGSSTDDVLEIDGASNRGIDQIRELRDTVKYAPARSRYRVIIIDEAHQISKDGFNALLKTLEEPPPHVVFMMATTEAQKIPETILSRCQRFQLRAISPADIADQLRKIISADGLTIEDAALDEVARAAHGSLRDALSLMDQVIAYAPTGATAEDVRKLLGLLPRELVRSFTTTLREESPVKTLQAIDRAVADGFDLGQLTEALVDHFHRLLLWKAGVRDPRAADARDLEVDASAYSVERLERDLGVAARAAADLRRSESPRVTFELACLELSQGLTPVDELIERLEDLEKRLSAGAPPSAVFRAPPASPSATSIPPPSPRVGFGPPAASPALRVAETPTPAPAVPLTGPDGLRAAWVKTLADVEIKKPSLAPFLSSARPRFDSGGGLELACAQEFQKQQLVNQQVFWSDLLRAHAGRPVTVTLTVAAPPPAPAAPRPQPAPVVEEAEEVVDEEADAPPPVESPATEGEEQDPRALGALDAGLKKVLDKFPGKIRKADPAESAPAAASKPRAEGKPGA
jgi:DNA polymerase-3 subunit gamma/tau